MNYAIQTLEIEIAHLREARRRAYITPFKPEEMDAGHFPDFEELDRLIFQLTKAIEILNQHK